MRQRAVLAACGDPVSYQGYSYSTVQIGDQCWFSENCRYLRERRLLQAERQQLTLITTFTVTKEQMRQCYGE